MKRKNWFALSVYKQWSVVLLIVLLAAMQAAIFFTKQQKQEYISDLSVIEKHQKALDSLIAAKSKPKKPKRYPFNPNFLTDYKAYMLGIPQEAFDRLQQFRKEGKFVNSAKEFQRVTLVGDSLLKLISPYFKFPHFVKKTTETKPRNTNIATFPKKNINTATAEDFQTIYGIGKVLSERIVKFRDKMGGFNDLTQCYEVYGLDSVVVNRLIKRFYVLGQKQGSKKKSINTITLAELQQMPQLTKLQARKIIALRTKNKVLNLNDFFALLDLSEANEAALRKQLTD